VSEHPARSLWHRLEPIHAVTYFSVEGREANTTIGLRGFWMGYFGARAAPLGPVGPGVVEAAFFGFAPRMVRRAIPDAWSFAPPDRIVDARRRAAGAALRRLVPSVEDHAGEAAVTLRQIVDHAADSGRVLFAANRDLDPPDDPVENLWWLATCLREHRGDGHVSVLSAAGLDGCEAHVLFASEALVPDELLRDSRGWTADQWRHATERLTGRGLLGEHGITDSGRGLRRTIESRTDELASSALSIIDHDLDRLLQQLEPTALAIDASGEVPFPNPMGLPPLAPSTG